MKKIIVSLITVIILLTLALSLTACGNTPTHLILESRWTEYEETSHYEVSEKVDDNINVLGSLTVNIKPYDGKELTVKSEYITSDYTVKEFFGYTVTSDLVLDDGQYKHSVVVLDKHFKTLYSYADSHFIKDKEAGTYEDICLEIKYNSKDCTYTSKGIEKSGTISYKEFNTSPYFDNAFYLALSRTLPVNSNISMAFSTPSFRENKMLNRSVTASTNKTEITPLVDVSCFDDFKEGQTTVPCYIHNIKSEETVPGSGTPIYYYVSSKKYKVGDNLYVENPLVQFEEHGITYKLKEINLTSVK